MTLLKRLQGEKKHRLKGRIYHRTQVQLAYNTNRIEGSKLSEEQTRYIYETSTLFVEKGQETANVDDILETVNHFTCFDYMLEVASETLTEGHIKNFHKLLKTNTSDAKKDWFKVGDYKMLPNEVGGIETTLPEDVAGEMCQLLEEYNDKATIEFEDIVNFHYLFEKIHPFQDGNGRVGRLLLFKECLKHEIVPFIIKDENKFFYYRGLSEFSNIKEYLVDTCLTAQDEYKVLIDYFSNIKSS